MGVNIKNEKTHHRIRELARLADETMTEAVGRAVEERIARIRRKRNEQELVEKLLQIGASYRKLPLLDRRNADSILYDKWGLPK
jgi:hypothetical protein